MAQFEKVDTMEELIIEKVDTMEELIIENLGAEGALFAIIKALSYDTKEDIYDYIMRCHDLEID